VLDLWEDISESQKFKQGDRLSRSGSIVRFGF